MIKNPDGKTVKMNQAAWETVYVLQQQSCAYSLSFSGVARGQFQWHIEGRHAGTQGTSKSTKVALTVLG